MKIKRLIAENKQLKQALVKSEQVNSSLREQVTDFEKQVTLLHEQLAKFQTPNIVVIILCPHQKTRTAPNPIKVFEPTGKKSGGQLGRKGTLLEMTKTPDTIVELRPNVELGKKVCISTDQHGLIIDGYIMENESDSQIVIPTSKRILSKYELASWSFDKGFWHKDNKDYLKEKIPQLIMPKKGKANKEEHQEQQAPEFKKQRNKHSAVESNINELEQCGLDRCPDRGLHGFKRYVAIAFVAYNLKRIGREMQRQEQLQKKKQNQKKKQEQRARQAA